METYRNIDRFRAIASIQGLRSLATPTRRAGEGRWPRPARDPARPLGCASRWYSHRRDPGSLFPAGRLGNFLRRSLFPISKARNDLGPTHQTRWYAHLELLRQAARNANICGIVRAEVPVPGGWGRRPQGSRRPCTSSVFIPIPWRVVRPSRTRGLTHSCTQSLHFEIDCTKIAKRWRRLRRLHAERTCNLRHLRAIFGTSCHLRQQARCLATTRYDRHNHPNQRNPLDLLR